MRIRLCAALLLVATACAPRFEGTGELVGSQPLATGGPAVSAEIPAAAAASAAPLRSAAPARVPPAQRVTQAAGQTIVHRGGVVKVGGLFPLSGGLSALGTPAFQAADAYFRWLNDNGGIDGTKIQFVPCDDQADDTRSTTCAKKLVEQDGVFVMGPSFTPFSLTVIGQLEQAGVPWVGFDGINIEGFAARNVVTVGAPIEPMAHALVPYWFRKVERSTGKAPTRVGAVILDVAPAKTYLREAKNVLCPKLGCQIVREQPVNFATTEYATICRNMQNDRVDTVWIITDPASAVKLYTFCREINYRPPAGWLGQHGIQIDLTLKQAGSFADGTVANSAILPDTVDAPATAEMRRIVTTYYRDAEFGYFAGLAYASARLVEDVIRQAFALGGDLTRQKMLQAAGRMTGYDCHGLCKDVNLAPPAAASGGNHNVWIVHADRGRWVYEAGPIDAWRAETWPRPGRP